MRFSIGDLIVYGETGVCRVDDIVEKEFMGEVRPCYKLQPLYQSCMIFTPADNEAVFMRPIISAEEAKSLIDGYKFVEPEECPPASPRALCERYDKIIKLHDCSALIKLSVSIRAKREALLDKKKKLSAVDERYLKRAEDLLYGELAAALNMEKHLMSGFIHNR
jgi:CarD family transcriptional regulator